MAAFDTSLIAREAHQLIKRKKNFAQREPGVILVFCIIGSIVLLVSAIFLSKKWAARREAKEANKAAAAEKNPAVQKV